MPAGATASFESLLDSLGEPPVPPVPQPSSQPPSHGAPPVAQPASSSSTGGAHEAKDPDELLDQLLESLDIEEMSARGPPPTASHARSSARSSPHASVAAPSPASPKQPNPRASLRQETASTMAGVEDSLDSLIAALDGGSSASPSDSSSGPAPAASRQSVSAPAVVSATPPSRSHDVDFDSLLSQLGEVSGDVAPAPARPTSHREPQPEKATLRPSFASTYVSALAAV